MLHHLPLMQEREGQCKPMGKIWRREKGRNERERWHEVVARQRKRKRESGGDREKERENERGIKEGERERNRLCE